jgi:hypothetical protein
MSILPLRKRFRVPSTTKALLYMPGYALFLFLDPDMGDFPKYIFAIIAFFFVNFL